MSNLNKIFDVKTTESKAHISLNDIMYSIVIGNKQIQHYDSTSTYNKGDLVYFRDTDGTVIIKECVKDGTTNTLDKSNWKEYKVSGSNDSGLSSQDTVNDISNIAIEINKSFGINLLNLSNTTIIDFTDDVDHTLTSGFEIFGQLFI